MKNSTRFLLSGLVLAAGAAQAADAKRDDKVWAAV